MGQTKSRVKTFAPLIFRGQLDNGFCRNLVDELAIFARLNDLRDNSLADRVLQHVCQCVIIACPDIIEVNLGADSYFVQDILSINS